MMETFTDLWSYPWLRASIYFGGSIGLAYSIRTWLVALVLKLTSGTQTGLDDLIAIRLRRPLYISIVLLGLSMAYRQLDITGAILWRFDALLKTLAILLWASAGSSILTGSLHHLTSTDKQTGLLQARTMPVISLFGRTSIWLFAVYLFFLSWKIDLTAWLASAGVIGLAVGFAAKDTLANLFAGIAILADSPFRVGDYITLEGGNRGRVTYIGMRSTRMLTADEIELIIPNSVIASSQIVNETGGPGPLHRLRMPVSVAYGSDPEHVRQTLLSCADGTLHLSATRPPQAFFVEFGDSSLNFVLTAWLSNPAKRESVVDQLNSKIYAALNSAAVEIPYNRLEVLFPKDQAPTDDDRMNEDEMSPDRTAQNT